MRRRILRKNSAKAEQGGVSNSIGQLMRNTTGIQPSLSFATCKSRIINTWNGFPEFAKEVGNHQNSSKDGIEAMKTNLMMWGSFMPSAMKAAIHLGPTCTENLEIYKNTNFEEILSLFGITQKLILEQYWNILKRF